MSIVFESGVSAHSSYSRGKVGEKPSHLAFSYGAAQTPPHHIASQPPLGILSPKKASENADLPSYLWNIACMPILRSLVRISLTI